MRRVAAGPVPTVVALGALLAGPPPVSALQEPEEPGARLYERWCAGCHGTEGRGDGPAAERMLPRPRDLTRARYQITSTASGELPTREDLMRVLADGLPGTTMPGWPNLETSDRRAVVEHVVGLSRFFEGPEPRPLSPTGDPGGGEEALRAGAEAWEALECFKCHGREGRGDGSSAPTLEDWRELPIRAADLTEPWLFNGGFTPEAIHTRLLSGMDGTPMPAYSDALAAGVVTEEQLWGLAHFVRSLGPARVPPPVRDVIGVRRIAPSLPEGPSDSLWRRAEASYVPLAGQVLERPRNFAPRVDGIWVSALHDGREMVLRLRWSDPSRSPDPDWEAWQERMAATRFDDGVPWPTEPLPDRLAVQFPPALPEGSRRPYFLMGAPGDPVHLWIWDSLEGVRTARAEGLGTGTPLASDGAPTGAASWEDGQWTVTFRRSLAAPGEGRPAFREGRAMPVAFFVWDGSDGEEGKRAAMSSWTFLVPEEAASSLVIVAPAGAVLATAALGLWAVARVRRRRGEIVIGENGGEGRER